MLLRQTSSKSSSSSSNSPNGSTTPNAESRSELFVTLTTPMQGFNMIGSTTSGGSGRVGGGIGRAYRGGCHSPAPPAGVGALPLVPVADSVSFVFDAESEPCTTATPVAARLSVELVRATEPVTTPDPAAASVSFAFDAASVPTDPVDPDVPVAASVSFKFDDESEPMTTVRPVAASVSLALRYPQHIVKQQFVAVGRRQALLRQAWPAHKHLAQAANF